MTSQKRGGRWFSHRSKRSDARGGAGWPASDLSVSHPLVAGMAAPQIPVLQLVRPRPASYRANPGHHGRVPEVDPDQEAAHRRLRAAFGFVEVLAVTSHEAD